MDTVYGKGFVRLNWWALIFIFAVTVAGSFVRIAAGLILVVAVILGGLHGMFL